MSAAGEIEESRFDLFDSIGLSVVDRAAELNVIAHQPLDGPPIDSGGPRRLASTRSVTQQR